MMKRSLRTHYRYRKFCILLLAVSMTAGVDAATASGSRTADVFPSIPEVRAANGVVSLELAAVNDPVTGAPAFEYQGIIGIVPTIRVRPGETIRLTLRNDLTRAGDHHDALNLHFHGLVLPPHAPGDEVLETTSHPGQTLHYVVRIPPAAQPGLYWYHPHAHGEAYRQVTGGMSGAIVVEGLSRRFPALATMRERIIVLRDVQSGSLDPEVAETLETSRRQRDAVGPARPEIGNPCRAEAALVPTINRLRHANIGIWAGERQFFRVLNAAASRHFDLSVDGQRLELVALDGVALGEYPGAPPLRVVSHVLIPPGGRAEFVVRGPARPSVLRSACVDSGRAGDANPAVALATLVNPSSIFREQRAPDHSTEPLAWHARSTRGDLFATPLPAPARRRTIVFSEDANGFYVNGRAFDMMAPASIVVPSGTVEEWTILNKTDEVHDFHIHQVHFVPLSLDGKAFAPAWLDTVLVPAQKHDARAARPSVMRLLIDFRDPAVRGVFVYHCHILDHEDQGMMAKIEVR